MTITAAVATTSHIRLDTKFADESGEDETDDTKSEEEMDTDQSEDESSDGEQEAEVIKKCSIHGSSWKFISPPK